MIINYGYKRWKLYLLCNRTKYKKKRKLKNLTQEQLAEKCNYSLSFIGNLESTKVFQTISVGSLYHIAKVLDISILELFKDIDK